MMTGTAIVSIIAMLGWLVLNVRAVQSHGMTGRRKLEFAVAWMVIIVGLAFLLQQSGV